MAKGARGRRVKRNPKKEEVPVVKTSPTKILFICIGVAVFLMIFYFLTLYLTSRDKEETNTSDDTDTTEVRENMGSDIILGRSLSMSDIEYYVLFYDMKDDDISSKYDEIVSNYRNVGLFPLYTVDMSSAFSKSYVTDGEPNRNPESESELLINGPTAIHVVDGKVTEYIEGEEEINQALH